jgi:hypothetical protein
MSEEAIRKAAKKWFYQSFDDDLLEKMQKHGLIAQAEGFSISVMAELELEMEEAFRSELAALREELAVANHEIESRISAEVGAIEALQAAEQRNQKCIALLRRSTADKGQDLKTWWNDRALILQAAMKKPTESVSEVCTSCDGSGEYIDAIGDWRGYCSCPAGVALKNKPTESGASE